MVDGAEGEVAPNRTSEDDTFVGQLPANPAQDSVIHAWLDIKGLLARAGQGKLVRVPCSGLDRQAVIDNSAILEPIISFFGYLLETKLKTYRCIQLIMNSSHLERSGTRPSIYALEDLLDRFMTMCRPRGRRPPTGISADPHMHR